MSGWRRLGGLSTTPSAIESKYALPGASILPFPKPAPVRPLERGKALQTFIDCLAVASAVLVVCITAASLPVGLFLLFFASY